MGATPIYQLPWPELPDLADAPQGFEDLARSTESALATVRAAIPIVPKFWVASTIGGLPNFAANYTLNLTKSVTIPAAPYQRIVQVNCYALATAGTIQIQINWNGAVYSAARNRDVGGSASVAAVYQLNANSAATVTMQATGLTASNTVTSDTRYTFMHVLAQPGTYEGTG